MNLHLPSLTATTTTTELPRYLPFSVPWRRDTLWYSGVVIYSCVHLLVLIGGLPPATAYFFTSLTLSCLLSTYLYNCTHSLPHAARPLAIQGFQFRFCSICTTSSPSSEDPLVGRPVRECVCVSLSLCVSCILSYL